MENRNLKKHSSPKHVHNRTLAINQSTSNIHFTNSSQANGFDMKTLNPSTSQERLSISGMFAQHQKTSNSFSSPTKYQALNLQRAKNNLQIQKNKKTAKQMPAAPASGQKSLLLSNQFIVGGKINLTSPLKNMILPTQLTQNFSNENSGLEYLNLLYHDYKTESPSNQEIRNFALDLSNQNVVKVDTERTQLVPKEYSHQFQQILTAFCRTKNLNYKQGMNEILAPLFHVALQKAKQQSAKNQVTAKIRRMSQTQLMDENLNLREPYLQMSRFIDLFQANIFIDNDFHALQSQIILLKLLLRYHLPDISNVLEKSSVTTEMYCIPWFITYMSNRFPNVDLLLNFWEAIVKRDDPTFIFFVLIALIYYNSSVIKAEESARLPEVMANLKVSTQQQLESIWTSAENFELKTPFSFKCMPEVQSILHKNNAKNLKETCQRLEKLQAMPMMVSEILFYAFHGEVDCSNPNCAQSILLKKPRQFSDIHLNPTTLGRQHQKLQVIEISSKPIETTYTDSNVFTEEHQESPIDTVHETTQKRQVEKDKPISCPRCIKKSQSNDENNAEIKLLVVDCRLVSLQKESRCPFSIGLNITNNINRMLLREQCESLIDYKDNYHLCLVGLTAVSASNTQKSSNSSMRLFHQQILDFVIEDLQNKGFKYISFLPGGYQECHNVSISAGLDLSKHQPQQCYSCFNNSQQLNQNPLISQNHYMMEESKTVYEPQEYQQKFESANYSEMFPFGLKNIVDVASTIHNFFQSKYSVQQSEPQQSPTRSMHSFGSELKRQNSARSLEIVQNIAKQHHNFVRTVSQTKQKSSSSLSQVVRLLEQPEKNSSSVQLVPVSPVKRNCPKLSDDTTPEQDVNDINLLPLLTSQINIIGQRQTQSELSSIVDIKEDDSENTRITDRSATSSAITGFQYNIQNLVRLSSQEETYLLNGIFCQFPLSADRYTRMLADKKQTVFEAHRLPAKKKNFQIYHQQSFLTKIKSDLLISQFTVAVLVRNTDLGGRDNILMSRFYMHDLIKITSRKSTSKIITFYYRIPKLQEYQQYQTVLEADLPGKIGQRPPIKYAFAFKRVSYEEVSMSFEFQEDDVAKECISEVSMLYKKLKNNSKNKPPAATTLT